MQLFQFLLLCLFSQQTLSWKQFNPRQISCTNSFTKNVVAIALSSILLSNPLKAISEEPVKVNLYDYVSSTSEEARIEKKIRLIKEAEGREATSSPSKADGDRYKATLAKEATKKAAINSKTKEQRQKDMCEQLGRGC